MYKKLESQELKKLISNLKIGVGLIQFTFLVFPLSMYIVYNKIIISKNPNSIIIIISFLLFTLGLQLILKIFQTINQNILKTDSQIKKHHSYLNKKLSKDITTTSSKSNYNIAELTHVNRDVNTEMQGYISRSSFIFLIVYFILILLIGGFIVVIPMIFFTLNFLIAKALTERNKRYNKEYDILYNKKALLVKEILLKAKAIKGLNLKEKIVNKYNTIALDTNTRKCLDLYTKNLLLKASIICNIVNVAMILIFGRYLYSLDLLNIEEIITCSLLTIWVTRSMVQIFTNLNINIESDDLNQKSSKNTKNYLNKINDAEYIKIKSKIDKNKIIYFDSNKSSTNLSIIYKTLIHEYPNISYINNDIDLFYGSLMDNITMFDKSKALYAKLLLTEFEMDNFIYNLPFHYNYVTTGPNDEIMSKDLKIGVAIIRELLQRPDIIIIDIKSVNLNNNLVNSITKYVLNNDLKIILDKSDFDKEKFNQHLNKIDISNLNIEST